MLTIDGSAGEGGGQVLRTALALSAITGRPFTIESIRGRRAKPGLLRQHLTGVRAVAEVTGAEVVGAELGSGSLTFTPGPIRGGDHTFAVGSAGSVGLVLQALLPVLLSAREPSRIELTGGTHNPASPPAPFLVHTLLPALARMGAKVRLTVDRCGFYPAGGGRYLVEVDGEPSALTPIALERRGEILAIEPVAVVSNLSLKIAARELLAVREALGLPDTAGRAERVASDGPGNAVWIEVRSESGTEVFTAFGRKGVAAEDVAVEAVDQLRAWRELDVPVSDHLADQLLVFLALAGGGSFRTGPLSLHTTTNAEVVGRFLERRFTFEPEPHGAVRVEVSR